MNCQGNPYIQLQSEFQNKVDQLFPGYHVVVIGIEFFEYIAAKIKTMLVQQALRQGNKLTPGNNTVSVGVEDIK